MVRVVALLRRPRRPHRHPVRQDPARGARARGGGRAAAGLRETDRLREVLSARHQWHAVRGHPHELSGDPVVVPGQDSFCSYAEQTLEHA
jgi:hypothetical protein